MRVAEQEVAVAVRAAEREAQEVHFAVEMAEAAAADEAWEQMVAENQRLREQLGWVRAVVARVSGCPACSMIARALDEGMDGDEEGEQEGEEEVHDEAAAAHAAQRLMLVGRRFAPS